MIVVISPRRLNLSRLRDDAACRGIHRCGGGGGKGSASRELPHRENFCIVKVERSRRRYCAAVHFSFPADDTDGTDYASPHATHRSMHVERFKCISARDRIIRLRT